MRGSERKEIYDYITPFFDNLFDSELRYSCARWMYFGYDKCPSFGHRLCRQIQI
jgi:hypothetical protein